MVIVLLPWLAVGELPGDRWLSNADGSALRFGMVGSLLLAADVLLPVPSSLVLTGLGARLGLAWGWCAAWLGLMGGCLVGYGLGALYPRRYRQALPEAPTLALLFVTRPMPVLAEVGALTAGACRVPLVAYLTACGLGNGIYAAVLCANAALLLTSDWPLATLMLPLLLPALGWLVWRRRSSS
jgi:uncharacterized membrane protein YdjX (TVP38/TMEM64 family)